jgi:hypothetical protein
MDTLSWLNSNLRFTLAPNSGSRFDSAQRTYIKSSLAPNLQPALWTVITVSLHENEIENARKYEEQNESKKYGTAGYF